MQTQTDIARGLIVHAVSEFFEEQEDGAFYPLQDGEPLVRIFITDKIRMERRRRVTTSWMTIVTLEFSEFCQSSFVNWTNRWQMTVQDQ